MPEMKYVRITVGDKRVCDDCIRYENLAPATLEWWMGSGYYPRQAPTECGPKCRCGLVPSTFGELETSVNALIEKAVQDGIGNTVVDLTTGRTLLLSDFENFAGLRTLQYEVIAKMEDMIYQWKIANGGQKLPEEFFELQDVEKMSNWLRRELK